MPAPPALHQQALCMPPPRPTMSSLMTSTGRAEHSSALHNRLDLFIQAQAYFQTGMLPNRHVLAVTPKQSLYIHLTQPAITPRSGWSGLNCKKSMAACTNTQHEQPTRQAMFCSSRLQVLLLVGNYPNPEQSHILLYASLSSKDTKHAEATNSIPECW